MSSPAQNRRVVVITGAAGGLGQGMVGEFVRQGWQVVAGCHQKPLALAGDQVLTLPLDVTNRTSVIESTGLVMARWGRIDALVCNAGMTRDELLIRQSEAAWDHIMAVNLKGAFNCAQAVLDPMLKQQDGQIIMISSFAARAGRVGQAGYAAAKAGLIGLVLSLARELGSRNVRVNAVLPGVMRTGMTANLTESELAALGRLNLLGRLNSVEEVARVIALLASTRNISGQIFQLDSRIGRST